jgi:hypothetical protein
MLEKDFVFIMVRNPQGYPQKLWIDVTRLKLERHFVAYCADETGQSNYNASPCCDFLFVFVYFKFVYFFILLCFY